MLRQTKTSCATTDLNCDVNSAARTIPLYNGVVLVILCSEVTINYVILIQMEAIEVIKDLVERKGCDMNLMDENNNTPLHLASSNVKFSEHNTYCVIFDRQ